METQKHSNLGNCIQATKSQALFKNLPPSENCFLNVYPEVHSLGGWEILTEINLNKRKLGAFYFKNYLFINFVCCVFFFQALYNRLVPVVNGVRGFSAIQFARLRVSC